MGGRQLGECLNSEDAKDLSGSDNGCKISLWCGILGVVVQAWL